MSRKLSDTKFREIYNKPLFGQFGIMNTLRPMTLEGDYMGSHNTHCQQNNLSRKSVHYKGSEREREREEKGREREEKEREREEKGPTKKE